ncbi:TPA: hypothetical protein MJA02_12855 [Klebsiella pneumoniae]|nr:hypothetical protein [Klebsiella pneumoniae]
MGKLSVLVLLIVQAFYFSTQVSAVTFSDLNGSNGISSPELSKKQGISIIRIDVPWSEIESVKGNYDYTKYDNEIIRAKKLGYDVLPVLAYAPVWNKSIKGKIGSPPLETSSWNGFVESTVKRYRAYPYNITYFQVWNEPTLKAKFWLGNNEDFVNKIYIPAAKIIKQNNGKVVFGGWPLSNSISEFDYVLEGLGAIKYTDIIDIHYRGYKSYIKLYDKYIKTNKADGIWQSELGYSSKPGNLLSSYLKIMSWALSHNWAKSDTYKIFWYPAWASREKKQYGLATTLKDGTTVLTENGNELVLLNDLYGSGELAVQDVQSNMKSSIDTDDYFFGVKISPNRIVIAVLYNGHDDYNQLNYSLMTKNNPRHITLVSSKRKQYQLDHTYEKGVTHIFVDKDKIRSISKGYSDVFFIKVEL